VIAQAASEADISAALDEEEKSPPMMSSLSQSG
jgi:hypothetical protein